VNFSGEAMQKKTVSGFTLIELMIVIAIIGIMAAIAAPNFRAYMSSNRLKGATRQVMSDLMSARMQAVSKNNNFMLIFDSDGMHYTILNDLNNNNAANSGEPTVTKNIQTDYHDVTFSSTANPIFTPRGTASLAGTITLTSASGSGSKTVNVAKTGRISKN
jgi:type IV fimbrial biogenesis protein FimT